LGGSDGDKIDRHGCCCCFEEEEEEDEEEEEEGKVVYIAG
jgi:hypothetical protein